MTYLPAPHISYATLKRLVPPGETLEANQEIKLRYVLTEGDGFYGEDVGGTFNRYDVEYELDESKGDTLVILTENEDIPEGTEETEYAGFTFEAAGGLPPYTWAIHENFSFPPGITLDSETGEVSGTLEAATAQGWDLIMSVTDSNDPPQVVWKPLFLDVVASGGQE